MKIVTGVRRMSLVGTLIAAALLGGTGRAHAEEDCNIGFVPNKPLVGVGTIIGSAWAQCDVPPERHEMRLGLAIRAGGQWNAVELISDDRIPTAARTSYIVKARCEPGMWRIEAEAVGTLHGKPFDFAEVSETRIVSAAECARGDR